MTYTPTTDEVRGIWNAMVRSTESFDRWLVELTESTRISEQERIVNILDKETRHYASTHYAGKQCQWCDIFLMIDGENK